MLVLALFLTLGGALQVLHLPIGMWLSELLIFFGLVAVLVVRSGRDPLRYPGLAPKGLGPLLLIGFLLGTLNFFALVAPLQLLMHSVMPESWIRTFDSSKVFLGLEPWELHVVLAAVTLAAPFCEEYFFRGVLQQGLQRARLKPAVAVLIASVIFSVFHLDPVGFLGRVELGVLFGLLYLRTGSLWPAIGAHMANNAVSSALFLAAQGAEAPAKAEPDAAAVALIAGLGGLFLLAVLWAIRTVPDLLPPHAQTREAPARPIPSARRTWGVWVAAMVLGLGLVAGISRTKSHRAKDRAAVVQPAATTAQSSPDGTQAKPAPLPGQRTDALADAVRTRGSMGAARPIGP